MVGRAVPLLPGPPLSRSVVSVGYGVSSVFAPGGGDEATILTGGVEVVVQVSDDRVRISGGLSTVEWIDAAAAGGEDDGLELPGGGGRLLAGYEGLLDGLLVLRDDSDSGVEDE